MFDKLIKDKKLVPLLKSSWSVSWPMSVIMFFVFLIGLTDVYVAGKISKETQAAYGISLQIYFIFTIIAAALTVGAVSVVSQLFTSHKTKDFNIAVDSSLISSVVAGILLSLITWVFSPAIIASFNLTPELKSYALPLIRIYSAGILFSYFLMNSNGVLRACGMIKNSLLTMAVVCILNIALNFILAFKTRMGYQGIAAATVISSVVGCLVNIVFLKKVVTGYYKFSWPITKKILNIGWPAGVMQVLWQIAALVLFLILSALPKNNVELMAAFTNGLRIEAAIFLPAFAFNMAAAVIVGNLLGKVDKEEAFLAGLVTAILGVLVVTLLTLGVMLNARFISGLLSDNQIVVNECVKYIYIALLSEPIMAWSVILAGGLNGAGDTKSVMLAVTFCVWILRVPLSYFFAVYFGFGAQAVWWAMNISIVAQAVLISQRYFSKKWFHCKHTDILSQNCGG